MAGDSIRYLVYIVDGMKFFFVDLIAVDGVDCIVFTYERRSAKRFSGFRSALGCRNRLAALGYPVHIEQAGGDGV